MREQDQQQSPQSPPSSHLLSESEALALAQRNDTTALMNEAAMLRDLGHGAVVTYSRKVFIPLTQLCRDVCHYCTFARTPRRIEQAYLPKEEVLKLCHEGAALGCQEALFTLGEKPELRYRAAREALAGMGYESTLDYVADVAEAVLKETGLLPHINAGTMNNAEISSLRKVSASMGIMLESAAQRLCEKGMPHYGSPDKDPAVRLDTLALAGKAKVPFTTGILIGIGETRLERIESLLAIRRLHEQYGHIQEVIVQNFRAKPDTKMAGAPEPDLEELLWSLAVARLIFGPKMSIQAPPNLSPGVLPRLIEAGINDWGGVSPLTPDHVNPEAPWPHLDKLARETALAGKFLDQRLTVYPDYALNTDEWIDPAVAPALLNHMDGDGYAKRDTWHSGENQQVPTLERALIKGESVFNTLSVSTTTRNLVASCLAGETLTEEQVASLFSVRGADFAYVCQQADKLRETLTGDSVSYVVNRNINYTNVCYFKCQFCAFSKGKLAENLRGRPYDISAEEIARRCQEAWQRGATEVCMQGGIHPDYTGETYLDIVTTVRSAVPQMHIHAFSPLEVWQGAQTLGLSLQDFLQRLQDAGLNTLPGTAAEILHDEVRATLCPDKLNSDQWFEVMRAAHATGFNTTATIMFGHIDGPGHWATHLLRLHELQQETGGFTEFVPLPYVHMEAPLYLRGKSRRGPSYREAVLMHAVPRLVFNHWLPNIQTSWVKMGQQGALDCLRAGANDLGGTLMNESITRAAGAEHGQEWSPADIESATQSIGRDPRMRTTLYETASEERRNAAFSAQALADCRNEAALKKQRSKRLIDLASVG